MIALVLGDHSQPITVANADKNVRPLAVTVFMMGFAALGLDSPTPFAKSSVNGQSTSTHGESDHPGLHCFQVHRVGGCLIQCAVLQSIVQFGCGLKSPWLPTFTILFLAAFVGVAASLMISAASKTTEMAMALVPVVLLSMILFGGIQPLPEVTSTTRTLSRLTASKWAFEGMLLLESNTRPEFHLKTQTAN